MQVMEVKYKDAQGNTKRKQIKVIRHWIDASGKQICLHTSGVYGYKDESPVKSVGEFSLIRDPRQRKLALKWWETRGEKLSREFYAAQDQELMRRQEQMVANPDGEDNTEMDMALYRRRPAASRKKADFSEPYTWYEWFDRRPDWWGQAQSIALGDYFYERVDLDETLEGVEDVAEAGEAPAADTAAEGTFN